MMDKKLSKAQLNMLHEAYLKRGKDRMYSNPEFGWFYPSRYETAAVFGTPATAAVLCGEGLCEYRTVHYWKVKGVYKAINQYRITEAGQTFIQEYLKQLAISP